MGAAPDMVPLMEAVLTPSHRAESRVLHTRAGNQVPRPAKLQIAQFEGEDGVYLLHLDAQGEGLTDTLHDSVEDAVAQAGREFDVAASDWTHLPAPRRSPMEARDA